MPTLDKGKVAAGKGAKKPSRVVLKETSVSGASAPSGQKRSSEGSIPPNKKGKGIMVEDSKLESEVSRLASIPELERIAELAAAHRKVHFISNVFLNFSIS